MERVEAEAMKQNAEFDNNYGLQARSAPLPNLNHSSPAIPAPESPPAPTATTTPTIPVSLASSSSSVPGSPSPVISGSPSSFGGFSLFRRSSTKLELPTTGTRVYGRTVIPTHTLNTLKIEKGELNSVAFSPSGSVFMTGGMDKTVRLYDSGTTRLLHSLHGAERCIMSVSFSPTGEHVIAASNDNAARVWDTSYGRQHANLMGHSGKVFSSKWTHDSRKIITGSHDRTIRVWDAASGYCNKTINCGSSCNDVDMTSDSNVIISGHLDYHLRCWDIRNGENIADMNLHSGQITSVSASHLGHIILTNSRDNTLGVVDTRTWKVLRTLSHKDFTNGLNWSRSCFSPDAYYACAGGANGSLFVWDVSSGNLVAHLDNHESDSSAICCCAWNPGGGTVVTADKSGSLAIWG
eukprot:TRINITY_DN3160_c0_g1_i4.p1 TRINITY_DN3160_c0_g1~~TRINITY_DN3160_c0_g1_i4.p1  ORF type:complete len:408 (+),score=46.38 TRINITY_DN3160_c0_g1_i4:637-1860(+)